MKTEQSRAEADKIESLVLTGGKRLEELIARGSESGDLVRLWEEGKEKLMGLVGKGSQVRVSLSLSSLYVRVDIISIPISVYCGFIPDKTSQRPREICHHTFSSPRRVRQRSSNPCVPLETLQQSALAGIVEMPCDLLRPALRHHDLQSQVLDLERHLSSLRSLAEDSPELAKIVADLEAGVARARELQVHWSV